VQKPSFLLSNSILDVVADIARVLDLHHGVLLHSDVGASHRYVLEHLASSIGRRFVDLTELAVNPVERKQMYG
jgi:hypothetical protein